MAEWNEKDHPRDGNNQKFVKKGSDGAYNSQENKAKALLRKLPDEQLPKSVGAKWANEDITMPDGSVAHFVEGSKLTHKEVFAGKGTKTPIRDIERLIKKYPGSKAELWQKVKAHAQIEWKGEILFSEIHWYEEPSVGRIETKHKKEL